MKEETKKSTKKQVISAGTATRGLINGFISYGFLVGFIFLIIYLIVMNCLNKFTNNNLPNELNYTIPAIAAILAFFLIRGVCYLSSFDLFKKCKVNKKDLNIVYSNTNLFFILLVILSVGLLTVNLTVKFRNQRTELEDLKAQYYEIYEEKMADDLLVNAIEDYTTNKTITLVKTMIFECGVILGLFSLFTHQKKLVEKLN